MLRLIFFISLNTLCFLSFGQRQAYFECDTINAEHLTYGSIDSIDLNSKRFSSSFIFSEGNIGMYTINPRQLFQPGNSIYQGFKVNKSGMIFTALPHIGFGYIFGAQGSQKINVDYEQAFQRGFLFNCSVDNFKTNGFLRNSNALLNNYDLSIGKAAKRLSLQLHLNSARSERNWNGGLKSDSLIDVFSLEMIPVRKENAKSLSKSFLAELSSKYTFVNASDKSSGILTGHSFRQSKRFFSEEDSIGSIYTNTFLDSMKTFDSLNQYNLVNSIGLFYKKNRSKAEIGVQSDYWNYKSFSFNNDTLEVGLYSDLYHKSEIITFIQRGNINLLGASSGVKNLTSVQINSNSLNVKLQHHISYELPIIFQRYFYSNNVIYKTLNLKKQFYQDIDFQMTKNFGAQFFTFDYVFGQFNDIYHFDSKKQQWRNDLSVSKGLFHTVGLNAKLKVSKLHSDLTYKYTMLNENIQFVPAHLFDARVFIKGGIFRAKKLKALLGLEFLAVSSYKRLEFIPQMTSFDLENSTFNLNMAGFLNAAIFTSFEVETFRLFIRMDNLASFWQDKKITLVEGYYFPSSQLKVGLTWDFWN